MQIDLWMKILALRTRKFRVRAAGEIAFSQQNGLHIRFLHQSGKETHHLRMSWYYWAEDKNGVSP